MITASNRSAFGEKLSQLYLCSQSLQHSFLEFRYKFEHFEQSLPLNLFLHGQQHLMNSAHNIKNRISLLINVVHPACGLMDASSLSQPQYCFHLLNGRRITNVKHKLVSDGLPLTSKVTSLDIVDSLTHISISDEKQSFEGLLSDFDSFSLDDPLEVQLHLVVFEFSEPEDDAATLDGLNDLGRSVTAEYEAGGVAEVADDHAESMLCALSQTVGLVQHDDLGPSCSQCHFFLRKGLDLLPHHVDAALIGGVELQSGLLELSLQKFAHDAEHTGCLTNAGRACQDEVGNCTLSHTGAQGIDLFDISVDFAEGLGAVLLQPDLFHGANFIKTPIQTALLSLQLYYHCNNITYSSIAFA